MFRLEALTWRHARGEHLSAAGQKASCGNPQPQMVLGLTSLSPLSVPHSSDLCAIFFAVPCCNITLEAFNCATWVESARFTDSSTSNAECCFLCHRCRLHYAGLLTLRNHL